MPSAVSPTRQNAPAPDSITAAGWRIVLLASLGGTLEFYDFVIFGVFARDIAAAVFPNESPIVSLMAAFARRICLVCCSTTHDRPSSRKRSAW